MAKGMYKKMPERSEQGRLRDAWLEILKKEDKINGPKRERAQKVCDVYADERKQSDTRNKFNILWSNTQVLAGALYSRTPKPDIRRRFLDKDPISREVSAVLERGASFSMDSYDFDGVADAVVSDYLTAGYGQVRVRYVPYFEKGALIPITAEEDGTFRVNGEMVEPEIIDDKALYQSDEIVYQEITCEPLEWKKFRWDHLAKRWEDVNWCCIDHFMTRSELVENFGDIGKKVNLTHSYDAKAKAESDQTHALVHEIFDKKKRQIINVSEGYKEGPINVADDELDLVGFFPFPKPLFGTQSGGSMFPIPEYIFYQDQAEELNIVTARIEKLIDALRVRGVYDQSFEELVGVLQADDNQMIPVKDFAARFEGKNLHAVLAMMPLEEIANVLSGLYQQRDQIKQTIYEITGIADIVRGSTNPNETLGAQQLKGQFADMRLSKRRNRVNAFLRDLIRIKTEIIAEHFEPVTLQLMTGIEITDQMLKIMRSDVLRGYKVDIETESTVAVDATEEQKNRLEALSSLSQFLQMAVPAVQQGFLQPELAKELALFAVRGFKHARQLEDVIERMGAQEGNDPIAMQQQLMQAQQQIQQLQQQLQQGAGMLQEAQQQAQSKEMEIGAKAQSDQLRLQTEERRELIRLQAENQRHEASLSWEREKFEAEFRLKQLQQEREAGRVDESETGENNEIANAFGAIQQSLMEIMERLNTPKEVEYDEMGRVTSIGGREVIRGESGRIEVLN